MKKRFIRLVSLLLTCCMAMGLGVSVSAAATAVPYTIKVTGNKLQFMKKTTVAKSYQLKNTKLTLKQDDNGAMVIYFTKKNETKLTGVKIGAQAKTTIDGMISSLTFDSTLTKGKTFTVTGSVTDMEVAAPVKVILADDSKVVNLRVTARTGSVTVDMGAEVKNAWAVRAASVIGEQVTLLQETSGGYKEPVYVEIEDDDEQEYTNSTSYETGSNNKNYIYLEAKKGVSLAKAMRDVKLSVYKESNDKKVSGRWDWVDAAGSEYSSGKYVYAFTPYTDGVAPVEVTVEFTGSGKNAKLSKPSLKFGSGSSHYGEANTDVHIKVGIPDEVDDEDMLYIYLNNKEVDKYELSASDAGESEDYYVKIGNAKSEDKFKIKVKVKRSYGSSTTTSKVLEYEIK